MDLKKLNSNKLPHNRWKRQVNWKTAGIMTGAIAVVVVVELFAISRGYFIMVY